MDNDVTSATQPSVLRRGELALAWSRTASALALAVAFVVRLELAWQRVTPNYLPDEYQYSAIARSLARLAAPDIRGHSAHFVATQTSVSTHPKPCSFI